MLTLCLVMSPVLVILGYQHIHQAVVEADVEMTTAKRFCVGLSNFPESFDACAVLMLFELIKADGDYCKGRHAERQQKAMYSMHQGNLRGHFRCFL